MAKLADRLSGLAAMPPAQLQEEWQQAYTTPCPRIAPALLRLAIAHRWQEKKEGGLPAATRRELERIAAGEAPPSPTPPGLSLRPGTQLIREWQGRVVRVEVVDDGFAWEGRTYASLSSIARAITGAHWSGPRFFGLGSRKTKLVGGDRQVAASASGSSHAQR